MGALQGPGPLPLLAFAYAAGVWLAATRPDQAPTALGGAFFPLALLALGASRAGRRRLALVLLALSFLMAGAARRHLAGIPGGPGPGASPCAAALARFDLPQPDPAAPSVLRVEAEVIGQPRFGPRGGVAEVLRDLYLLKSDKDLSFGERKMLDTARSLLIKELSLAKNCDEEAIETDLRTIFNR